MVSNKFNKITTNYYDIIKYFPFAAAIVKSGSIKEVNNEFLSIFSKKKKLIGKNIQSILPELSVDIIEQLKNGLKNKDKIVCRLWSIRLGKPLLIESIFQGLDEDYLLWIIKDCTEMEVLSQLPIVVYASPFINPHSPTYISDRIESMCGYKPCSFYRSKRLFDSLIHPEDKKRVLEILYKARDEKTGWDISYRLVHKDRHYIWVSDRAKPIYQDGEIVAVIGILKDITKEKEIELALAESHLRHQLLFEKAPIGIIYVDRFGYIVDCNDQIPKIFQAPKERFMGYNMLKTQNMTLRTIARNVLRGQEYYYEGYYRSEISGKDLQISVIATPLKNKEDNIIGGLCLVQDISRRVELEESLKREIIFKETILETVQALVVVLNCEGCIVHLNKTAEDKLAVKISEVKDKPFWQVWVPPENVKLAIKHFKDILRYSRPGSVEKELVTKNGKRLLVVWSYDVIKEDGKIKWVVGTGIDITEQRKMEEQLRQAQKMEAIHRLAGGVAHELNNQLTAISGYIQMLKERFKGDSLERIFDSILRASSKAAETTNKLLVYSHYEDLSSKKVEINSYLYQILKNFKTSFPSNIKFRLKLSNKPLYIKANELRLYQVFDNIIKNSKDAMPNGGIISISTSINKDNMVVITVSDTGIGMSSEIIEKAFEPFFTTKPFGSGQGLGLFTVYGIIKQYGGHIKLESQQGKGTKVIILLPAYQESE